MVPDAEAVITAYLLADAGVAAITDRIVGKTPSTISQPWVRVTLLDDPATDGGIADHHIEAYLQIDCFAGKNGNQALAGDLRLAVRDALSVMHLADHDGAVVTGAKVSSVRMPDVDFEPAMERYALTTTVWMRGE